MSSQLIFQLSLFLNIFIFQQQESDGDRAEETVPVQQEDNSLGPVEVDDAPTPPKTKRSKESCALMSLLAQPTRQKPRYHRKLRLTRHRKK